MKFKIITVFDDNLISQNIEPSTVHPEYAADVINLKDKAVTDALVKLGWKQPERRVSDEHNKQDN